MFKKLFAGISGVITGRSPRAHTIPSTDQPHIVDRNPQAHRAKPPIPKASTQVTPSPSAPDVDTRAREIILEARDEALRIKHQAEDEARRVRQEVLQLEQRLQQNQQSMQHDRDELDQLKEQYGAKLEEIAHVTSQEARVLLLDAVEKRLKDDVAKRIRQAEEEAKATADKTAREILVEAMYHGATDYVTEYTTTTVRLSDDEMKGRIIGREGRNIRSFEMATGVDVDVDDTPGEIRLSCFDPVRREIAKRALEKLMVDGRIQPTRIEELVAKTKDEVEKIMHEEGERLCHGLGVYNLPGEIVNLLGRFKYRFSYGQNMIVHTLEETKIGVALAQEVGADVSVVRLGCLLHDIGKILADDEGTHVEKGVALLKRYKFPQSVIECVAQHHEDVPFSSLESRLVYIADAISGSRPGARHEPVEEYIKRLSDLENIATSFQEVEKAFAIKAGREVRVLFKPKETDDATMTILVEKIAEKIEKELKYPGTIKVIGIRESRAEAKAA